MCKTLHPMYRKYCSCTDPDRIPHSECVVVTSAVDFLIFIFHGGVKLRYYLQGNK